MPFILTAFGLLLALGVLVFFLFSLARGRRGGADSRRGTQRHGNRARPRLYSASSRTGSWSHLFESSDRSQSDDRDPDRSQLRDEGRGGIDHRGISSPRARGIEVPPVVGQTRAEAERLITEAGLGIGEVTEARRRHLRRRDRDRAGSPAGGESRCGCPGQPGGVHGTGNGGRAQLVESSERDATRPAPIARATGAGSGRVFGTKCPRPRDSLRARGGQPRSSSVTPSSSSSRRAQHPSKCPT